MKIKGEPLIRMIYYFGLGLMIISLPFSEFFMSVAQFILTAVFVWEGINQQKLAEFIAQSNRSFKILGLIPLTVYEVFRNIIRKFIAFYHNKPALLFSSIWLMHVIGLLYTTDYGHAFNDIRIKLPLFLLPLFISAAPGLGKKGFDRLLGIYVAAVFVATLISFYIWMTRDLENTRHMSIYISHIRFSINICLAIFISWHFILKKKNWGIPAKIGLSVAMLWMVLFLFILNATTGIIAFAAGIVVICLSVLFQSKKPLIKYGLLLLIILVPVFVIGYVLRIYNSYVHVDEVQLELLDTHTKQGGKYYHDIDMGVEDGRHLGLYLCYPELEESWNQRSGLDFNGMDHMGQELKYTLIRYMSSKNLRKDADGIAGLTDQDIQHIEDGIANVNQLKRFSVKKVIGPYIYAFIDYRRYGNTAGYSSFERVELLSAASTVIRQHFLVGVGTGDIRHAMHDELIKMDSDLKDSPEKGIFSSHNQFMNIMVMFGVIGLAWFLIALIWPPVKLRMFNDYFFLIFFMVAIISMLSDDTLNTQPGVTFVAFFYAFFLFGRKAKQNMGPDAG